MTPSDVIAALRLPDEARVDKRVPKKLLLENGASTPGDKHQINNGIDELVWLAALKPATVGFPTYRDDTREYLEVAVLSLSLREEAASRRLTELIHRAIPYPVFLIQFQGTKCQFSMAHLRWSQGQVGRTVVDGLIVSAHLSDDSIANDTFLDSLDLTKQPRQNFYAFYQGWIETLEAHAAAQHTGCFALPTDFLAANRRRIALVEYEHLIREIAELRALAGKERQLNRRVEINLQIQQLESRLLKVSDHF